MSRCSDGELRWIVRQLNALPPGQAITIARSRIIRVPSMGLYDAWSPLDRIMENVIGSSFCIESKENPATGDITFYRLPEELDDGSQTYVSPDRRHLYDYDGLRYRRKS